MSSESNDFNRRLLLCFLMLPCDVSNGHGTVNDRMKSQVIA